MRKIKQIVVHCTATDQDVKISSIENYWINFLKWRNPGYHILVRKDGSFKQLLPDDEIANGVKGHNLESLHIGYVGGIDVLGRPMDNRTPEQKSTLYNLLCLYKNLHPDATILGHRDFPGVAKACPSFNAKGEYSTI